MNNIYVINAKDANVNPIYLEKICFKPMIEYCIETLIDISNRKPIIMTDSPGKLSCYNNVAEVVKDINGFKAECNVVVVNAASPLITIDVIKNSREYTKTSSQFKPISRTVGGKARCSFSGSKQMGTWRNISGH